MKFIKNIYKRGREILTRVFKIIKKVDFKKSKNNLILGLIVVIILVATLFFVVNKKENNSNKNLNRTIPSSLNISGGNGEIRIIGIKIEKIKKNNIEALGRINNNDISFDLKLDGNTVVKKVNATSTIDDLKVGDIIFVTGTFEKFTPNLTVLVKEIRSSTGK